MPPALVIISKRWVRLRSIMPEQFRHIVPAFASYGSRAGQVHGQSASQRKWLAGWPSPSTPVISLIQP